MEGGSVNDSLGVAVERPVLDQLQEQITLVHVEGLSGILHAAERLQPS